jgi:hypothetical protein
MLPKVLRDRAEYPSPAVKLKKHTLQRPEAILQGNSIELYGHIRKIS